MGTKGRRALRRILLTLLITGAFTVVQLLARPLLGNPPFALYYPAIILCSIYGNGLLAVALTVVIAQLTFPAPPLNFPPLDFSDFTRSVIFVGAAVVVHFITRGRSRALEGVKESETRLRSILANAPDGVVATNGAGAVTIWNPQAEKIFGIPGAEAMGRPLRELVPGAKTAADPLPNEARIERKAKLRDGREILVEVSKTLVKERGDQLLVTFVRDITESRVAERDLKLKSGVLENSLNGFDIVNERGEFTYANRTYLKMWGYDTLGEILGTSAVGHCADPDTPRRIISTLKETGECNIEFLARRKDGTTFDVHMWARLDYDADGNEIYPSTSVDITERKRAEAALKEAVRARDEFISVCSHELKTPITSMKMQFQTAERMLKAGDLRALSEEAVRKRVSNSNRQLDRMSTLIEEMLDVSRLSEGRAALEKETADMVALVRDVAARLEEQFTFAGVPLRLDLPDACVSAVDRYRIEQVLANLLTNALKYGAGRPVGLKLEGGRGAPVRVTVSDQGEGIAPENLERIFLRFERANASRNVTGLGLGLYICRRIVEAHGGRIWAESEPGRGSSFLFELP